MPKRKSKDPMTHRLFRDGKGQNEIFDKSVEQEVEEQQVEQASFDGLDEKLSKIKGPVECLGMTFENDEKRREYFLEKLREKLKDPEFRKIEGFPIGEDEDILALSDPPYYTACPNPFIEDFIKHYGKPYDPNVSYSREPFAADVKEGKNDPIYNAHTYHTKVPHKAIMRYILHYTEPGDIVFDGFCGTGMTGIAAQMCGNRATVESLGYKIKADGMISDGEIATFSKLGERHSILSDLSTIATFIAGVLNAPKSPLDFQTQTERIIEQVEKELKWAYATNHGDKNKQGKVNYVVWSEVFVCSNCSKDIVFYEGCFDQISRKLSSDIICTNCGSLHKKRSTERAFEIVYDYFNDTTIKQVTIAWGQKGL